MIPHTCLSIDIARRLLRQGHGGSRYAVVRQVGVMGVVSRAMKLGGGKVPLKARQLIDFQI